MPDSASDSRDDQPPRGRIAEGARELTKAGRWLASLKPDQALMMAAVVSLVFICTMYGWQSYVADKRANETVAMLIRASETDKENLRHHCEEMEAKRAKVDAELVKEIHASHAVERVARMKFEGEERAKDRAEQQKWRDLLAPVLKKVPVEVVEAMLARLRAVMP